MGTYLNPGNAGFEVILNDEYVDKTGLIDLINQSINTPRMLSCISRPRRFGKSFAAKMLCAYYDCSCDSHSLFDGKEIARTEGYLKHLNRYNVINLDISGFVSEAKRKNLSLAEVPNEIVRAIHKELKNTMTETELSEKLTDDLIRYVEKSGKKIVFIIDEWDALIREEQNDHATQSAYFNLLREWFKNNNFTPRVVAAVYMTGILPIKKDGSQSAISDFLEYPIISPDRFGRYAGFTEDETRSLCQKHGLSFEDAKKWYDGYEILDGGSIYNPYSVMQAVRRKKFDSYWQKTSAAESLMTYVNMNFKGLQETIACLIAGEETEVKTDRFENDFQTFKSRDDILTLLIHLGYLTWNQDTKMARIPNEEVRLEFEKILEGTEVNHKWIELIDKSKMLLEKTFQRDEQAVARAIEEVRCMEYAPTFYNDEQALRYVIKFAYIAALDKFLKVEELPSGKGIADVVYVPKLRSNYPAIIIELKWDKTAGGAIEQIKEKAYPSVLQEYGGEILLVGINYDSKKKSHSCKIELYEA